MMAPSPHFYIWSFKAIGPLVSEKKIFEGFLPEMVIDSGHLGHMTKFIRIKFPFPSPMSFNMEIGFKMANVSKKIKF